MCRAESKIAQTAYAYILFRCVPLKENKAKRLHSTKHCTMMRSSDSPDEQSPTVPVKFEVPNPPQHSEFEPPPAYDIIDEDEILPPAPKRNISVADSRRSGRSSVVSSGNIQDWKKIMLTWEDINVFVGEKDQKTPNCLKKCFKRGRPEYAKMPKHILKNVSGVAEPGQLLAILGSRFVTRILYVLS